LRTRWPWARCLAIPEPNRRRCGPPHQNGAPARNPLQDVGATDTPIDSGHNQALVDEPVVELRLLLCVVALDKGDALAIRILSPPDRRRRPVRPHVPTTEGCRSGNNVRMHVVNEMRSRARENLPNAARMLTRTLLLATTAGAAARKLALGTTTPLFMLWQQAQDQRRRAGWYYRDLDGYPSMPWLR